VPDVLIFQPLIAIELKYGKNRITPEQKQWLTRLSGAGWKTAVCRSVPEVLEVLKSAGVISKTEKPTE